MTRQDIVVATMTRARDDAEARALEEALEILGRHRLSVVVTDGGSSENFVAALAAKPYLTVRASSRGRGLVPQVKSSITAALREGARAILYTEPDKAFFFTRGLMRLIECWLLAAPRGLVLAGRSAESFATFPPYQRHAETLINDLCGRFTGVQGDYSYGPFVMDPVLAGQVLTMPDDLGWGWRPCLFGLAVRMGYSISWYTDDLPCPDEQRAEGRDDRFHRLKQLEENSTGLGWAAGVSPLSAPG